MEYNTEEKIKSLGFKKGSKHHYYKNSLMGMEIYCKCNSCGRWNMTTTRCKRGEIKCVVLCDTCQCRMLISLDNKKLNITPTK